MSDFIIFVWEKLGFVAVGCVEVFPVQFEKAMNWGGGSTTDKEGDVSSLGDINEGGFELSQGWQNRNALS